MFCIDFSGLISFPLVNKVYRLRHNQYFVFWKRFHEKSMHLMIIVTICCTIATLDYDKIILFNRFFYPFAEIPFIKRPCRNFKNLMIRIILLTPESNAIPLCLVSHIFMYRNAAKENMFFIPTIGLKNALLLSTRVISSSVFLANSIVRFVPIKPAAPKSKIFMCLLPLTVLYPSVSKKHTLFVVN